MFQVIIKLIAVLMILAGVILIYDARIITKKFLDLVIRMKQLVD